MAHQINRIEPERRASEGEKSLGDLFSDLSRETTTLVRQEMALAKVEMSQKAAQVGKDVGYLTAGGFVLYAGFLALIAAAIIGFGQAGLTWWVSALLVGLVVAGIGALLVVNGINDLKHTSLAPTQTLETLREDTQWAKEQTS